MVTPQVLFAAPTMYVARFDMISLICPILNGAKYKDKKPYFEISVKLRIF
jgi:hypothetical protein